MTSIQTAQFKSLSQKEIKKKRRGDCWGTRVAIMILVEKEHGLWRLYPVPWTQQAAAQLIKTRTVRSESGPTVGPRV